MNPRLTRARRGAAALVGLAAALASACQVVGGFEGFSAGAEAAAAHACAPLKKQKVDARALTKLVRVDAAGGYCFWASEHEVTVDEYARFVSSGAVAWDAVACGWKSTPSDPAQNVADACRATIWTSEAAPFDPPKPIRCVDWCDALAFCRWTGGSLCSAHVNGGNTYEPVDAYDAWGLLCGGPTQLAYPYGPRLDAKACNLGQIATGCFAAFESGCGPSVAGHFAACVGPSGVRDALGNVAEWTLPCRADGTAGPDTACLRRGGAFGDATDSASCSSSSAVAAPRGSRDPQTGIRCCHALSADEQLEVGSR